MKSRCTRCGKVLLMVILGLAVLSGSVQAGVVSDKESGFQITIPKDWHTNAFMDGSDKVWAFAAPDNNAAVRVRTLKSSAGLTMETLVSAFEKHVLGGGQRLKMSPYTLNGIQGTMAAYRGRFNNIDVGVGCFFTIQKRNAYIVWSMIPVSLFSARSGQTDTILNSFTLTARTPRQASPESNHAFQYRMLTVDDSNFEFLYPQHFKRFQQAEGQSQWADPNAPAGSRVVMVIQTMSRSTGNSLQSVYNKLIDQVKSNAAAKLLGSERLRINGIPAYELRFTLKQKSDLKYFYYLVLDLQGAPNVATVSFVGRDTMLNEMKQHFAELKKSIRKTRIGSKAGR